MRIACLAFASRPSKGDSSFGVGAEAPKKPMKGKESKKPDDALPSPERKELIYILLRPGKRMLSILL